MTGTHCLIHREALASKTRPVKLREQLLIIIKVVNYVKGSALDTRLFRSLCSDMDAAHDVLVFHTQVRWLSKGNMLARFFELWDEVKSFLGQQQKRDLLLAQARLAYLTDIF